MDETKRTTVLAISRQLGSGGSFIGQEVARRLGFHYVDRDILSQAAQTLGVEAADLEPLDERVETFWERLAPLFLLGVAGGPAMPSLPPYPSGPALFEIESSIIQAVAGRENAIIVGRGGAHVLRGHPGLVSVFVHSPEAFRIPRVMQAFGVTDTHAASEMLRRSDSQRANFHKALTNHDWADASMYDLCLNTSNIGLEEAAKFVTEIVARRVIAVAKSNPS
jgi:cytidylate kinase